jgi:hypothetical protein
MCSEGIRNYIILQGKQGVSELSLKKVLCSMLELSDEDMAMDARGRETLPKILGKVLINTRERPLPNSPRDSARTGNT